MIQTCVHSGCTCIATGIHDACEDGQLTYREKPGTFNSIWTDIGVKQIVIKDAKNDRGVIGLSRKSDRMVLLNTYSALSW